ncbi:MAG: gamma-glutamyltransferase [Congregibacter sp.]
MNSLSKFSIAVTRAFTGFTLFVALSTPYAQAQQAAIASPEPHATDAAAAVLREGGNAVDAAVAIAFTLAVTLPDAGNIGGGGFMTLYIDGERKFLDYREVAPVAASRNMYLNAAGDLDGDASLTGHRAAGVPGTVAGLWKAHQAHGQLPWDRLLEPAIKLAKEGFKPYPSLRESVRLEASRLEGRTNFLNYYGRVAESESFVQAELGETLQRIADRGVDGFYRGKTAELLVAEMQRGGGLITARDLDAYKAVWRKPLIGQWRGYEVVTAPLPSSGGFAVLQFLSLRDLLDQSFAGLALNSPPYIHLKAEIEKRIFADRARYLGDPDFVSVPMDRLLSPEHLAARALEINPSAISPTESVMPMREPMHTTHFSVLDHEGNAVSNTYTLNTDFGSGVVVEGAGFLLNNEMDDFAAAPGIPNIYGVVGDEANAIAPGKRMLSSMSPTVLLKDDSVAMVVGAMGGSTIFTTVYQTILNLIDFGLSADEAVAATRVHHQLLPKDLITYSPTTPLSSETVRALLDQGYRVEPHSYEYGNVQLIWKDPQRGLQAVSDQRFVGRSEVLEITPQARSVSSP